MHKPTDPPPIKMAANLRVLSFNPNSIRGKLNTIKCYVETYSPDLVAITETKIDQNFDDNELLGDQFTLWRKDRSLGGGGVLIAMNNNINAKVLNSQVGPGECVALTLQIHAKIIVNVVNFYRPPSEHELDNFIDMLETFGQKNNSIFVGDYNLPDLDWITDPDRPSVKETSHRVSFHQNALDKICESDLKQLILEPTHKLGNILDLVLVHNSLLDEVNIQCEVLPRISDHNALLIDVFIQGFSTSTIASRTPIRRNFNKADYRNIDNLFAELKSCISDCQDVSAMIDAFDTTMHAALDEVPKRLPHPKGHPWISRHLARLTRKRARLYTRNKNFPSIKHEDELDNLNAEIASKLSKAKADYLKNNLAKQMQEGNSKPLYNYLKRNSGRSNNIVSLQNTEPEHIPNALADHFAAVFNKKSLPTPDFEPGNLPQMDSFEISKEGLRALITKIDIRKCEGPDNIPGIAIKNFTANSTSFLDCVHIIMSRSLATGKCPTIWKKAIISPIFKGGDRSMTNNYRPISLTCILCKLFEHIISSNMWNHIDEYGIISDNQHGFRSSVNTTTQLLHVTHHAAKALDAKLKYHVISFDFTKAFDRVPHELLIHKLTKYKFDSRCVAWIKDWLHGRVSAVTANGQLSREFDVCSGVPQGSVLGPLLFLVYINDITTDIVHSDCRLYADDTLLSADTSQGTHGLQQDVTTLYNWSIKWGMLFNSSKCVHMQIGFKTPEVRFYLGNDTIPTSDCIKYLGVYIQYDLKWKVHITTITAKANRSLGALRRNLNEAPSKTKIIAYKTIVRPILEYASQVWSPHNVGLSNTIDRVQRQAVRWAFWLGKYDSVTDCMLSNQIVSLHDRRHDLDILMLRKIEAGLYEVKLNAYVRFSTTHNTRGKVIGYQHNVNQWRYSFFNRIRDNIKVYFDPDTN